MTEFISQVKAAYDVVIFDTTPILPATDATILGTKVDGIIILYRVGKIARGALKRAKTQMDHVKANVLGIVLNGLKPEVSADYQHYGYYRYYSYGEKGKEEKEKLAWYKMIFENVKSFFTKGKEKGHWFSQLFERVQSFFRFSRKKEAPQVGEFPGEKTRRWGWWVKIALLAVSVIALIAGLLWQFEILRI